MSKQATQKIIHITTILCLAAVIAFAVYGMQSGIFKDRTAMESFVTQSGIWGPVLFILLQIVQVVVPIIPGAITCAVGVVLFGPWYGLLYNYIGIVIGSLANFYLARRYGQCFVKFFVKEETYDKYAAWLDKGKKFDKFFALAIIFPCAPDDLLCMLAGLTRMSFKKFTTIILLGKPASIAMYSIALLYAGTWMSQIAV